MGMYGFSLLQACFWGRIMKRAIGKVCWIGLLVTVAGCNLESWAGAGEDRARDCRDRQRVGRCFADRSRRRFRPSGYRQGGSQIRVAVRPNGPVARTAREEQQPPTPVDNKSAAEAFQSMRTAVSRVRSESERLEGVAGLPVEFWKVFDTRALDFARKGLWSRAPFPIGDRRRAPAIRAECKRFGGQSRV